MLWLVACLALCSLCVGNSEGSSNLEKSQEMIGGSTKYSHALVNAKLHQRNTKGSGQNLERLLEVVEVKYLIWFYLCFNLELYCFTHV